MEETVIKVEKVSKDFKLPHEKAGSVKSLFVNPFNKSRKKFEVQHALKDISFEIKKGEFFGIVGRNGSGKSTLLKIIAEIYQPTKGKVTVNGRLVPFIELGVGFNPELSGRENVYLNGSLLGFSNKEVDNKYSKIVDFAELEPFMDQKLKNYSSGMQVRLAFSVATILAESDILLIDEVLAVGDADFQRKCFAYFKKLKKEKKTVVFVSHDMSAIREYCDRAVLINESKIKMISDTDSVAQEYEKLFSVGQDNAPSPADNGNRWGVGDIKTKNIKIELGGEKILVRQTIVSRIKLSNPTLGIRIRSISGESVTGTNSKIEKVNTGVFKPNIVRTIIWSFPNILSDGEYFIDPAIIDPDGVTVQDWWDEARKLTIVKGRHLPYLIDPSFSIKLMDIK